MERAVALAAALAARGAALPGPVEWHRALGSTSDRLKELARVGSPEWTVVLADEQLGGRGREGRRWSSPAGGLYLSVLLRPRFPAVGLVPLAAGVAVADAARELGVAAELKWPNDVLVAGRKLAGILAEAASGPGGIEWLALGIGVNVALVEADLPAELRGRVASLGEAGTGQELPSVAAAVLALLHVWYDALGSGSERVVAAWRARAVAWWGEPVEVRTGAETLRARLVDVDADGALVITVAGGETRRLLSGEILALRRAE